MRVIRRLSRFLLWLGVLPAFLLLIQSVQAEKVVLRIRVTNKDRIVRDREVRSDLPRRVRTNDIINLDGMDLGYDIQNDVYYVKQTVQLQPKGQAGDQRVFRVEIKDIWTIPEEELTGLRERTTKLTEMLQGRETDYQLASDLKVQIDTALDRILKRQQENAIQPEGMALGHITAYDANLATLKRARKDIRRVENLVLGSGQDPGELIESPRDTTINRQEVRMGTNYNTITYRLVVRNPSPNEARVIDIESVLPREITPEDIQDAAGLLVGKDPAKNACFLYKQDVQIPPGEQLVYTVKIWDKWNINKPRIPPLRELGEMLLEKVQSKGTYQSVEKKLTELVEKLGAIEAETGPEQLSPEYVAFYREQATRLDRIEEALFRIKDALNPVDQSTKYGFKAKPPSMKSTWLIIYIILGFLAVISLLFFLRWYGKTSSELMEGDKGEGGS